MASGMIYTWKYLSTKKIISLITPNVYFLALFTTLFVTSHLPICSQMFPYYLIFKISIELKMLLCYIINTKEQSPTRWFDQFNNEIEIPPFHSPKFQGWFFYVELLTKRKDECKQCQKEQTKSHQILKIKMIFHRHHPHSFGMRSTHPVSRLFHALYFITIFPVLQCHIIAI